MLLGLHVSKIYSGCKIVEGGRTRQESVFNGINHCSQSSKNVLIKKCVVMQYKKVV